MKKIKIFKSGFCEKLKLLLIPIGLLIGCLTTQMWAYNLERAYLKYSFNGSESTFDVTDDKKYTYDAGTLTGSFDIKGIYIISSTGFGDNWTGGKMGYTIYHNGSETSESNVQPNTHRGYGYNGNAASERQDEWEGTINITSSTSNSGIYYFKFYFVSYFGYGKDIYKPNGTSKEIKYTILPPDVSDFTITPSGILSGTGTSDDPYILPHGGTLSVTLSGASQAHSDANSSAEYSVNGGSTWGTTSTYTSYTTGSITDIDVHNYVFKARYNNSDESLTGAEKSKTIYYKTSPWAIVGTMNNWDINTDLIRDYAGGTGAGYVDINLDANTEYEFKVKDRTKSSDDWFGFDTDLGYSDSGKEKTFSSSGGNCSMTTAGAGTYRFTWDGTNKKLTVTYPTSYTVTFGYGTGGSEVTATGSGSGSIESGKYVKSGENVTFTQTNATGYTFKGWYTTADGNTTVSTMGVSDNILNGIGGDKTVYAQYTPNEHTITLTPGLSPSTGTAGTESVTVTYNASTNLTGTITTPTREGYTFAGYEDASHNLVIDEDGDFTTAGDYIDGDDKWIVDDDLTLTAKWTDNGTYVFTGGAWNTASNWTKGVVPGSSADVILLADAATPSGITTVNSIRIATSGTYTPVGGDGITANGSLTVSAGSALKVTTSVQNCVISANAPTSVGSTTSSTLDIRSGGALAWGGTDPGDATVQFTTRSGGAPGSNKAVNQYFGIPFTSMNSSVFDDAWVFAVSGSTWAEINNATMAPFTGYNIILQLEKDADSHFQSYGLTGTLVGRGASLGSGVTAGTETLYANSWVSPIKISEIGFSGTGTIYIFSAQSAESIVSESNPVGNYTPYTINNSSGSYIPSMQSFSIISGTSISIDYATAVYGEITGGQVNYAPRRNHEYDYREAIWATQDTLTLDVKGANGWSDKLKMFIHEDFSMDYENGWDGPKMEGMWEAPKLYTLNNEGEMAVSCVPNADNSVIAFHAGTASNEYTFTFKYSGEDELILKDTKTGVETPIEDGGTYEFTSNTSDDDLRFVIKKVSNAATGVDEIGGNASGVQKIMYNGTMYILREGRIYSAEGAFVK